jgi:uncharacterized iron-regulated membrane protein
MGRRFGSGGKLIALLVALGLLALVLLALLRLAERFPWSALG